MAHYMVELVLANRPVLVIGGGKVARRKIAGVLICGAVVTVLSPVLEETVAEWAAQGRIHWRPEPFTPECLDDPPRPALVFAAAGDAERNRRIALACRERGLLCNSADDPAASGFLVTAMHHQGPVTLGVGTGGLSPAASRHIKDLLVERMGENWGEIVRELGKMREEIQQKIPDPAERERYWRELVMRRIEPPPLG
ncbi:MAG: bifunctional precorrin-2 dehydrogenase/sirohydrochlorin ferrochelatase [Magnetococcales bacterium]|nr:bifunctional precorrin-2 dehydrogenase/sirohydrochlorin ferrochelatase [Magnetococcales bacterium]